MNMEFKIKVNNKASSGIELLWLRWLVAVRYKQPYIYWNNKIKTNYPYGEYLGDVLLYDFMDPYEIVCFCIEWNDIWYNSDCDDKPWLIMSGNIFQALEQDYPEIGA